MPETLAALRRVNLVPSVRALFPRSEPLRRARPEPREAAPVTFSKSIVFVVLLSSKRRVEFVPKASVVAKTIVPIVVEPSPVEPASTIEVPRPPPIVVAPLIFPVVLPSPVPVRTAFTPVSAMILVAPVEAMRPVTWRVPFFTVVVPV